LRDEALAVDVVEEVVVGEGSAGHFVDGGVGDDDAEIVFFWFEKIGYVELVRRAPDETGELVIDEDLGGFTDRGSR
jgi:hypothetical protein